MIYLEATGLVLEGGGMRGVYTAGVLDFFMDKNLYIKYTIGASAGACNGASYISKQRGRSKRVNIDYINDPRYLSYRNLFKEKSLFGMNFLFDEIPNNLIPFDYEAFNNNEAEFCIATTDCIDGTSVYFNKSECSDINMIIRASSSLPFFSPIVEIEGKKLLDGGIADSIPINKAIKDGYNKNIVILTRNRGYRKKPFSYSFLTKAIYRKYGKLATAIIKRGEIYNKTLDLIDKLEKEGMVFVIAPKDVISVGRTEKDKSKLLSLYDEGYKEATDAYDELVLWLSS